MWSWHSMPRLTTGSMLRSPGPIGLRLTSPKIPPSPLWKGQSTTEAQEGLVCPDGMSQGRWKTSVFSETGSKAGNHLLHLVSPRSHFPSLEVSLRPGALREGPAGSHGKGPHCSKAILPQMPSPRAPVACPHPGDTPAVWGQAEAERPVPCGTGMEEPAELPWRFSP